MSLMPIPLLIIRVASQLKTVQILFEIPVSIDYHIDDTYSQERFFAYFELFYIQFDRRGIESF